MGLFDKALKGVLAGSVKNAVNKAAHELKDAINDITDTDKSGGQSSSSSTGASQVQQPFTAPADSASLTARFDGLLRAEFPGYTVERGVTASALGFSPAGKPYDYCLYKGGVPAGVIMLTEHNRDRNAAFLNAKAAAKNAGVPFINFYTHFPNENAYVTGRIKSFIR